MPSQWDQKADKDLLLAIIDEGTLKSIEWPKISAVMLEKGYTFTHEACRQHFQKIRREAKNGTTTGGDPTTPTKPKAAKGTPASKRGHGKAFNNGNGADGDDDEPAETPVKRKRGPKKEEFKEDNGGFEGQTAAQFKVEEVGDVVIVDVDDDDIYV